LKEYSSLKLRKMWRALTGQKPAPRAQLATCGAGAPAANGHANGAAKPEPTAAQPAANAAAKPADQPRAANA
jgi:hypothetical protein